MEKRAELLSLYVERCEQNGLKDPFLGDFRMRVMRFSGQEWYSKLQFDAS